MDDSNWAMAHPEAKQLLHTIGKQLYQNTLESLDSITEGKMSEMAQTLGVSKSLNDITSPLNDDDDAHYLNPLLNG